MRLKDKPDLRLSAQIKEILMQHVEWDWHELTLVASRVLSGRAASRVTLARIVGHGLALMLLDEPFSTLGPAL
jgi:ABC-type thiamine transport system ATPase subunit